MEYLTFSKERLLRIILLEFSRFGETLRITQEHLDARNFYIMNPEFDTGIAGDCCDKK
ncbi:MAG: hypothetical protein KH452_05800 [Clostridiales bacterium]|nr:hypothetical protein [Clostridiales bacterium]